MRKLEWRPPPTPYQLAGDNALIRTLLEHRETERLCSVRAWHALMLAPTLPTWRTLLRGDPVPEDQLDRQTLRRARARAAKATAARQTLNNKIREAHAQGMSLREIATAVGVSHETVRKTVGRENAR